MASVHYLVPRAGQFLRKIQTFSDEEFSASRKIYFAARTIQALVRGFITRQYIKKLNKSAVVIQKWYRGWRGRVIYRRLLKKTVEDMFNDYYNKKAVIIQKTWYGYLSRRDVFSYYALKAWIRKVQEKNEEVLSGIKANEEALKEQRLNEFEIEAQKWVVFILAKLHHLLSTKSIAGVYSVRYTNEFSAFENLLKSIRYKKYMTYLRKCYTKIVKTKKLPAKSGQYLPVIGQADLYWYLSEEDIESMIQVGKELKNVKMQKNYANNLKEFSTFAKLSCKEKKEKDFCVTSVYGGKYQKAPNFNRVSQHEFDLSKTKFDNYANQDVSRSTLNYIEYHVNVLLKNKNFILENC